MPTTARGIYYPDKSAPLTPLHTHFSSLAESVEAVLDNTLLHQKLPNLAAGADLAEGTTFYVEDLDRLAVKRGSGTELVPRGRVGIGLAESHIYSGGGLVPGATEIALAQVTTTVHEPCVLEFETQVDLVISGNCAGFIKVYLGANTRSMRYHSRGASGSFNRAGSVKVNATPGNVVATISGLCEANSAAVVQVADITSAFFTIN